MEPVPNFTVIDSPRAVVFRDRYNTPIRMRLDELHKFSDGTLEVVDEALDFRVKEYRVFTTRPGRYTNHWTDHELKLNDKFLNAIRHRLKMRRIFRSLESFVGGRLREGDYRILQRTD